MLEAVDTRATVRVRDMRAAAIATLLVLTPTAQTPDQPPFLNDSARYFAGAREVYAECLPEASELCARYVKGIADIMNASNYVPVCVPADLRFGAVVNTVQSYLRAHPEMNIDRQPGTPIVYRALVEAFPCAQIGLPARVPSPTLHS